MVQRPFPWGHVKYKGHHRGVLHTLGFFSWNIRFGTLHNAKKAKLLLIINKRMVWK
jgi:hypothetical protein